MVKLRIILSLACFFPMLIQAASLLQGRVCDSQENGLFSVLVCLKHQQNCCCYSDTQGYFSLEIPDTATDDSLFLFFVGYKALNIPLKGLNYSSLLEFKLQEDNRMLNAALIEHNPRLSEAFSLQKVDKMDIYLSPVSDGDPLKAVSFLPASSNTAENANPEFRGSPASASQVLLNGISITAPVRNTQLSGMGNFSLFNTELIGDMTIYAGNPPLSRANALSGLVEINTCNEIEKNETQLAFSMANAGLFRAQKLGKEAFVQGYANHQFSEPYLFFNSGGNKIKSFRTDDAGLNFRWEKDVLFINLYAYGISESFRAEDYAFGKNVATTAQKLRQFNVLNLGWHKDCYYVELNSGNNLSRSDFALGILQSVQKEKEWKTSLNIKFLPLDFLLLQTGLAAEYLSLDFKTDKPAYAFSMSDSVPLLHQDTSIACFIPEAVLYAKLQLPGQITLGLGLRKKILSEKLPSYLSYQLNLRKKFDEEHSFLISAGNYQSCFYPVYRYTRFSLQTSRQMSLEYTYEGEQLFIQTAAYLKREKSPSYFGPEYKMKILQREILGLECSAEYEWSRFRASFSYTLLKASIEADNCRYKAENDLPCFLKAYCSYTGKHLLSLSCSGVYRMGLRYTPVESGHYVAGAYAFEPQYGALNSQRYTPYFRLDLSLNQVVFGKNQRRLVLFATVGNILNRKNQKACLYSPDYSSLIAYSHYQGRRYYLGAQLSF
ncbi:MAG: TonB-dependent receptor [Bacteroidales bacterium]|nr:TonB-dependent receptor [Bacteroidales bacterium]MDD3430512.1 TonB-dependent receptor [Bacteroidales bacterium]MDD4360838.1 TonB-dependent receptor [Bacteroidales bacterium]MDD4430190.1 TonB-dependent receptor [Bacteroidales bacterium]